MNTQNLLDQYFETAFSAPDGIKRLRELILTLAMQGKLVPQDPRDQPARELLREIEAEKQRLIKAGKIKKQKPLPPIQPEEIPYDLPENWEWVKLGNLTTFNTGKTPASKNPIYWSDTDGQHWSSIADLPLRGYLDSTKKKVTEKAIKDVFKAEPVPIGTLLMSFKLSIGKTAITKIPTYHNEAIISFPYLLPELKMYLFWLLDNITNEGDQKNAIKGNTLNSESLNKLFVPLPPLAEQKRIVEKIESLMAQCDELEKRQQEREQKRILVHTSAVQKLLNAPEEKTFGEAWQFIKQNFGELYAVKENVSELRKAILQLAVMGKLVPQDPNDPPASELLKEITAEKQRLIKEGKIKSQKPLPEITADEIPYNLPSGWSVARFQTITKVITCGIASTPNYYDKGRIFLSAKNVKPYKFMPKNHKLIDEETYQKIIANAKPEKGDILMTRVGAGIGESAIIDQDIEFAYYVSLTLIKPFLNFLDSFYLLHFLNSEYGIKNAISQTTGIGASQGNLNVNSVRPYVIPIPPLPEQHRIVAKVDALMALCDQLKNQIDQQTAKQTQLLEAVMAGV